MNIVAFSGKARSGKTTAANAAVPLFENARVRSFAEQLKSKAINDFFPTITPEDMLGDKKREIELSGKTMSVRRLLIDYGKMFRALDRNFWVKSLWSLMIDPETKLPYCENIFIDDLRYKSEAEFLTEKGARLIRIERPGIELIDDSSETELDKWSFHETLVNDGTKESFVGLVKTRIAADQPKDFLISTCLGVTQVEI